MKTKIYKTESESLGTVQKTAYNLELQTDALEKAIWELSEKLSIIRVEKPMVKGEEKEMDGVSELGERLIRHSQKLDDLLNYITVLSSELDI